MKTMSIKLRITLWFTALMLILSAGISFYMLSISDSVVEADAMAALTKTVENALGDVHYEKDWLETYDLASFKDGVFVSVYDESGQLLTGLVPSDFELDARFEDGKTHTVTVENSEYYVYDRKFTQKTRLGDMVLWYRGIIPTSGSAGAIRSMIKLLLIILPIFVLLSALGGYFIAKSAFKPVEKITATADKISGGGDLSRRLNTRGAKEIKTLSDTFDRMLDRLEKSFKAEKQFTSDASHELRTPTTVILAECDYALANARDVGEYRESVEVIQRQATKMSGLISRMLTFTRLEQGTERISRDYSDLSELTAVVCEEHAETSGGITISSDIQPRINAYIDVMLITRLLDNLIDNAVKYGKEGGFVKVSLKNEGGEAVLTVADNGVGIQQDQLPLIWNRFYQGDKSGQSGVGLGLAMVKQIADLHGGVVTVESAPGEGSRFTFKMPV